MPPFGRFISRADLRLAGGAIGDSFGEEATARGDDNFLFLPKAADIEFGSSFKLEAGNWKRGTAGTAR